MKKYLLVFLALGSLFALTACPDNEAEVETPQGEVEVESTESGSGH